MKSVQRKKGFDYKWVIVAVCFLIVFVGLGFCSTSRRLFFEPITEALGIENKSMYGLIDTFRYIASATINLFFAVLIAKFGAKKLICAGIVVLMAATLCFAYAPNLYFLWLGGALLGVGFSWTTTTMVGSVINRWFKKNTGTIMGIVLAANGVGAALAAQLFDPFIQQGTYGYRNAYLLTVGVLLALLVIVVLFFRNSPKKSESMDFSNSKNKKKMWEGIAFSDAVRKPYFYIVSVCVFLTGFVLQGITGVDAKHIGEVGLGDYAASMVSISSLVLTFSKFLAGFSYDKFGLRISSGFCLMVSVVSLIAIYATTNTAQGIGLMYVYAVGSSFALPLETIMISIYAKDLFGEKSYEKFLGLFVSINTIGYATGGVAINAVRDIMGSYKPAFLVCTVVMALIFVLMQYVITVTNKMKKQSVEGEVANV